MKMEQLAGKNIKISGSTIVALNDAGKTAGMVRGLDTYYQMSFRDQMEWRKYVKQLHHRYEHYLVGRLFRDCGRLHYIIDDAEVTGLEEWAQMCNEHNRPDLIGPGYEQLKLAHKLAAEMGAAVIHVAGVKDTRKEVK